MLKEANKLSKEMEERFEEIEEFIRAFVQHVLWKKTNGEEGTPWPCDSNDCQQVEDQKSYATSQVDDSQPPEPIPTQEPNKEQAYSQPPEEPISHLGNIPPLLEEVTSPLTTLVVDLSDDEVDEEIVVESPQMVVVENAHCDTFNSSCVVDDVVCNAPMCGDHDALSASCDDDFDLNEPLPCSCDDDKMCMDCIDLKYDKFVALHEKNFGRMQDTSHSANDASSLSVENVEACEQLPPCHEHCISHDHNSFLDLGGVIRKDSHVLNDKIVKENESFHLILSCDLPPDLVEHSFPILHKSSYSSTLLPSTSCDCKCDVVYPNTKLDSSPFLLQTQDDFENLIVSLTPMDGSNVDFLGCDSYLESFDLNLLKSYSRSLQVCLFGFGTAPSLLSLQEHNWRRHVWYQPPSSLKIINRGEGCSLKSTMFLILDENFSFKYLKIP